MYLVWKLNELSLSIYKENASFVFDEKSEMDDLCVERSRRQSSCIVCFWPDKQASGPAGQDQVSGTCHPSYTDHWSLV